MIIADFNHMRLIMVHIPKAAGSALRVTLNKHRNMSIAWTGYTKIIKGIDTTHNCLYYESIQQHFKDNGVPIKVIASIRNPYDRIYSAFIFNRRTDHYRRNRMNRDPRVKLFTTHTFLEFVKNVLPGWVKAYREQAARLEPLEPIGIHFAPMMIFLTDRDGQLKCDHYIRQECFEQGVSKLCQDLQLDLVSPRTFHCASNNSPPITLTYLKHYDEEAVRIINELYDDEFTLFGYRKVIPKNLIVDRLKALGAGKLSESF